MILNKLKQLFLKNKKEILFFLSFIIIIISTLDTTFALEKDADALITWINYLLTIISTIVAVLTSLVSLLLNPGWINGTIFGFDIYLKEIWVLISNIVYFIFAFILIAISFMNIVGNWAGNWELKQALPKFVVWVIMVPFTWFFVQFILSISAFLTVAVLSLPHDVMDWNETFKKLNEVKICKTYIVDLSATWSSKWGDQNKPCSDEALKIDKDSNTTLWAILSGKDTKWTSWSVFWILNIYTYSIMKVDKIKNLQKKQLAQWVRTIADLSIKIIFDLIFIIVFVILIIALFMALFARWVWLWIYAMFSPIFGLLFFFWKAKDWVGDKKFWVWEFIKLALVPVYVSAALAFGLLFIFVASQWLSDASKKDDSVFKNIDPQSSSLNIWWFKLVVKWAHWWLGESKFLSELWWWLWQLILELFWLAILWIAVMAALKSSEITGNVIAPIEQFWKSIGSLIAKSPQYAPIIPTPGGMMNTQWLQHWTNSIISDIQTKSRNKSAQNITSIFWEWNKTTESSVNASTYIEKATTINDLKNEKIVSNIRKAIIESWDATTLSSNKEFRIMMEKYWKVLFKGNEDWLTKFNEELKKWNWNWIAQALFLADKQWDRKSFGEKYSIFKDDNRSWTASIYTKTYLDKYIQSWGVSNKETPSSHNTNDNTVIPTTENPTAKINDKIGDVDPTKVWK